MIGVFQLANANGLQLKSAIVDVMKDLEQHFPDDVVWGMPYDTSLFIEESIHEVLVTLLMAIILVMFVVYAFLQELRATLIPMIAVPVSLIATLAVMLAMGFSINTVSLLGLVLAVALVVDDAIVVVENVMRHLESGERDLVEVTKKALAEVRGPVFVTTLVLLAVFVPVAFIPGLTGRLYNQFALTIAIAVAFSGVNSLTLSPALCAVFLKPREKQEAAIFRAFNAGFDRLVHLYSESTRVLVRYWYLVLLFFAGICVATVMGFQNISKGFVPEEDRGYVLVIGALPEGATIARTQAAMAKAA